MLWFHRLFPPLLMLTALVFTLLVKRRPGQQLEGERFRLARLASATFAFIALHAIVQTILEHTLPVGATLRALWPTMIAVLGCVTLWMRFAGPALAAREPGFRPLPDRTADSTATRTTTEANATTEREPEDPHPGPAVRSASLAARHEPTEISTRAWTIGWSLFGLSTVATLWAIAEGAHPIMLLGLSWWIGMAFFGARATRLEPEPMDAAGNAELAATYAKNRAFRSWAFFALGISGTVAFTCIAILLLAFPAAAGLTGGMIGSTIGVAGATFGVLASVQRAKAQALLHELSE